MSKLLRIMIKWGGFLALFGCSSAKDKTAQQQPDTEPLASVGLLQIHCNIERTASGAWYNQGGKPGHQDVTSYFSVRHQGKPVSVSTLEGPTTYFWQALILKDAPKPAVLIGTHSMYLITDENGKVNTKPVNEQDGDFGSYQWLDSANGQPGKQQKIYLGDDSRSSRLLSGGRYLMVNTKTVLDVQTLTTHRIDNNTSALVDQLDGFNAFGSEVVILSPGKTQLVLIGYRRNMQTNISEYALVPIDFVKNQAYHVTFDRTDTHFLSIWDATPAWIATYFDWTTDHEGKEKLSLHPFKQLPYWKGRWKLEPQAGQPKEYELTPVSPSIITLFMDCVQKQYTITDLKTENLGEVITNKFTINGTKLTLYFIARDKTLSLNCDDKELIIRIGENFDKELAKGNYQNEFGKFNWD